MISTSTEATVIIRPMKAEDVQQVQAIDQASFSMPWPASSYNYELNENPHSMLWVAEVEAQEGQYQVVGVIVVWLILDEAHIASIAVHPQFRGRSIGKRLLNEALRAAIQKGAVQATLEVRAGNQIAQQLYKRFGFEVAGFRPRYYSDNNEDALIMTVNGLDGAYLHWLLNRIDLPRE
jgi:[ribosomal protein S18]-alanine N-acetyltransferase